MASANRFVLNLHLIGLAAAAAMAGAVGVILFQVCPRPAEQPLWEYPVVWGPLAVLALGAVLSQLLVRMLLNNSTEAHRQGRGSGHQGVRWRPHHAELGRAARTGPAVDLHGGHGHPAPGAGRHHPAALARLRLHGAGDRRLDPADDVLRPRRLPAPPATSPNGPTVRRWWSAPRPKMPGRSSGSPRSWQPGPPRPRSGMPRWPSWHDPTRCGWTRAPRTSPGWPRRSSWGPARPKRSRPPQPTSRSSSPRPRRSRSRPTCWRSTPRSRRRARGRKERDSVSLPKRCASWQDRQPGPPPRPATRSRAYWPRSRLPGIG